MEIGKEDMAVKILMDLSQAHSQLMEASGNLWREICLYNEFCKETYGKAFDDAKDKWFHSFEQGKR